MVAPRSRDRARIISGYQETSIRNGEPRVVSAAIRVGSVRTNLIVLGAAPPMSSMHAYAAGVPGGLCNAVEPPEAFIAIRNETAAEPDCAYFV